MSRHSTSSDFDSLKEDYEIVASNSDGLDVENGLETTDLTFAKHGQPTASITREDNFDIDSLVDSCLQSKDEGIFCTKKWVMDI